MRMRAEHDRSVLKIQGREEWSVFPMCQSVLKMRTRPEHEQSVCVMQPRQERKRSVCVMRTRPGVKWRSVLLLVLLVLLVLPSVARCSFQPALVLAMARVLLENYCLPENLSGMQEAIGAAIRSGEILTVTDRRALAGVLTAGVQGALNDPRLTVTFEPHYVPTATTPALGMLSREQLVRLLRSSAKMEHLEGGVAYLRLDRILGREALAKLGSFAQEHVWNRAARASALILDLRHSVGGELSGVPYVVSFFTDPPPAEPPRLIESVYERPANATRELWTLPRIPGLRYGRRKDLIVLTSRRTSGAAESLAYALKNLNRAILVGERTAGGSVRVDKIRIESSGFYITVPTARSTSPLTGQSWEVNGVAPSVAVRAKEALAKAKALLAARGAIPKAVRSVADLIERYYAARDKVKVLLEHLDNTDFFTVTSEDELAAKLNYELQYVCEDPRLVIKTARESPPVTEEPETAAPNDPPPDLQVDDIFKVEVRSGNSGYLRISRLPDAATLTRLEEQMVKKVWQPIRDTDYLVLDLRSTVGGQSEGLPMILSYLHDPPPTPPLTPPLRFFTLYDSVRNTSTEFRSLASLVGAPYGWRRDVYVLTGSQTAAAGEELAYLMQSLRRGTVVGEITAGNLLHSRSFRAPGTGILVTVPILGFLDNNGESWLGGGVVPDAIVLAEEAEEVAVEIVRFHGEVRALVEGAGLVLEEHYALPEVASRVRAALRARWAEGFYRPVVDYESLASQMTSDLQEASGDHRLHVFYCDGEPEAAQEAEPGPVGAESARAGAGSKEGLGEEEGVGGEERGSMEGVGYAAESLFRVEVLGEGEKRGEERGGNVGYLRLDALPDGGVLRAVGEGLVAEAWARLAQTDALVIDLRYTTAGPPSAVPLLASYFFIPPPAPPTHLYSLFDRASGNTTRITTLPKVIGQRYGNHKPLLLLTSHLTGSAAEAFARALQELGRARVVGEGSLGGGSSLGGAMSSVGGGSLISSGMYQIGDSILYASLPNQAVLSAANQQPWSASGAEPDVPVAQGADALAIARRLLATARQPQQQDSKTPGETKQPK